MQADVVPIVSFGEWELMDNIYIPWIQEPTKQLIGFPFPFIPTGRFGLPMPRKPAHGVTVVVGAAVEYTSPEPGVALKDEEIEVVWEKYFEQLQDIFDRYKAQAGYPNHNLILADKALQSLSH